MRTIVTSYHGCTQTRPARMRATNGTHVKWFGLQACEDASVGAAVRTPGFSPSLEERQHIGAAKLMQEHMEAIAHGWAAPMTGGSLPNGDVAWVFQSEKRLRIR